MNLSDKLMAQGVPRPHPRSNAGLAIQRQGVPRSLEFDRIKALPRRRLDLSKVEDLTPAFARDKLCTLPKGRCTICNKGRRLLPIQSAMLWEAEQANGLFAAVGVGHGKTLASFLLPDVLQSKVSVLLIPPHLRDKTQDNLRTYGDHFKLPNSRVKVVAYSELSSADSADILERLQPDLIIADEAHCLRHKDAARTKRFLRYMKAHPGTRFCAMSGSMTDKSIKDYAHLIELALRKNSPLPNGYREIQDWAEALDLSDDPMPPGMLLQLDDVEGDGQKVARTKFRSRLVESVGVVATEEGAVGCSLIIMPRVPWSKETREHADALKRDHGIELHPTRPMQTSTRGFVLPPDPLPSAVRAALKRLCDTWEIGNEELVDAPSVARAARQLALGFYYRWKWPNGVKDVDWLDARAAWHRAVRDVLRHRSKPGLDSPMFVANAAARGELPNDAMRAWGAWCMVKDRPQPPTEAVWIDDFAARVAAQRATASSPYIVWCEQTAFGEKVAELAELPYYAGGTGELVRQEKGDCSVILSIKAHSEGHDHLSAFNHNLVTCPPISAKVWEQMLGRTHRLGQAADEVRVEVFLHTDALRAAFDVALEGARYVEQTQGQRQKLLYADRLTHETT